MRRHPLLLALPLAACLPLSGCFLSPADACGLSTTPPTADDVADGHGKATRSDGQAFDVEGSWAPAPSSSIVIGTLSMAIAKDQTGSDVDQLIEDGAFPICIPQGERSDTSGNATIDAFVTDAAHTGGVSILGRDGELLVGRFALDLAAGDGSTLSFTDGVFRIPQR